MTFLHIAAISVWAGLFFVGLCAYAGGRLYDHFPSKRLGEYLIGAWMVVDLILIICAYAFGWLD